MDDWKLLLRRLIALQAKANVNIDVSTLNPLYFLGESRMTMEQVRNEHHGNWQVSVGAIIPT